MRRMTGMKGYSVAVLLGCWINGAWAGPFDNAVGTWWGQAEYLAKVNAVVDESAAAVVDLTVRVEAGGKISG